MVIFNLQCQPPTHITQTELSNCPGRTFLEEVKRILDVNIQTMERGGK